MTRKGVVKERKNNMYKIELNKRGKMHFEWVTVCMITSATREEEERKQQKARDGESSNESIEYLLNIFQGI